ncbi:hypothetical protein CRUP_031896 [Coryphaenoides rupestris]|nr:hypothetical protein CRUP_031896 [Coryphaenoides rupestris]
MPRLRKRRDTALVHVSTEGPWSADADATLSYTVQEDFLSSTWDWIALYKAGFKSASDYEAFVWVRDIDLPEVNEVIQSLVGLSDNFQIVESKRAIIEGLVPENINGLHK